MHTAPRLVTLALILALTLAAPALADGAIRPASGITVSGPDVSQEIAAATAVDPVWVKVQADWERLEPSPGAYDQPNTPASRAMAKLGQWLAEAKAQGAQTQLIVADAPAWASGRSGVINDPPTPGNVPRYAAFMRVIAERYGQSIDAYVPWNEPNIDLFWDPPDAAAYVNLQRAVYESVKPVDPTAVITSAPIAGTGGSYEYLTAAYRAGLGQWSDVLSWNSYPPGPPELRVFDDGVPGTNTLGALAQVDRIMARAGVDQDIWIGEFGWSTCVGCTFPNRATESLQAKYLPRTFLYFRRYAPRVKVANWFKLIDGANKATWQENSGLLRFNWTPKPAYAAFANVEQRVRVPAQAIRLNLRVARRGAGGISAISRLRPSYSWGQITLRSRIAVPRNGMFLLQGYKNGHWSKITTRRISGAGNRTVRFDDSGQLAVRMLVRASGDRSWTVGRVLRLKGTLPPA